MKTITQLNKEIKELDISNRLDRQEIFKKQREIKVLEGVLKLIENFPSYDIYSEVYDEYKRLDQHVVVAEMFGRFKEQLKQKIQRK